MTLAKKENREAILMEHFSPHSLRHTFATRAFENGLPPKTEYSLTDRGEKIGPILNEIYRWSVENYAPPTEEVKDDFYSVFK